MICANGQETPTYRSNVSLKRSLKLARASENVSLWFRYSFLGRVYSYTFLSFFISCSLTTAPSACSKPCFNLRSSVLSSFFSLPPTRKKKAWSQVNPFLTTSLPATLKWVFSTSESRFLKHFPYKQGLKLLIERGLENCKGKYKNVCARLIKRQY